jgi:phenylpropionate dioxygenase-like ring-hydroxylating dioxygenase large terminal subunit
MSRREENELLTRTGPGTPGGDLMRRYWQPVALARELKDAPLPVRILGEDLVLFRDGEGRLGLLDILCSHRCADLSYGRIEPQGLRCLYHGWLYDRAGRCLEQPAEPQDSKYKDEVHHKAYPCQETGGVILAYLGPQEPPLVPNFHFLFAPERHLFQTKVHHACNYLQANEGNLDPAHLSFLHALNPGSDGRKGIYLEMQEIMKQQTRPKISVERTRFGIRIYSERPADGDRKYLRISNFVFPNMGFFAGDGGRSGPTSYSVHWHVPIDDESHWRYDFYYEAKHGIDAERLRAKVAAEVGPDFMPIRTRANRYLQNREEMRRDTFSGMGTYFPSHDLFAVESAGAIHDRSREHLASSDVAIVAARRMMLDAIHDVSGGKEPPLVIRSANQNVFNDLVVMAALITKDVDAKEHCAAIVRTQDFHALQA